MVQTKQGFLLVELLIAMVLIGIMATIIVPNLRQQVPGYQRQKFIGQLNALLKFATERAIVNNVVHRITVDLEKKQVFLEQELTNPQGKKGEAAFGPVKATGLSMIAPWPATIEVKNFYIQGEDEFAKAGKAQALWFFLMPNGLAQDVIINLVDTQDSIDGKGRQFGLVLNPFTAQFKVYDSYQKP